MRKAGKLIFISSGLSRFPGASNAFILSSQWVIVPFKLDVETSYPAIFYLFMQEVLDKNIDIFILIYISIVGMVLMEIKSMEDRRQFEKISKTLADPRRVAVFEMISQYGEISCGAIANQFPVKQSTISHHLKILVDSGLVNVRREGQFGYFSPRKDVIENYINELRNRLLKEPPRPQIVDKQS